eukprot:11747591-Alexandrium_andersonii.AAC.1
MCVVPLDPRNDGTNEVVQVNAWVKANSIHRADDITMRYLAAESAEELPAAANDMLATLLDGLQYFA